MGWIENYNPQSEFKRQELYKNLKELRIIRNGKTRIISERENIADLFKRVNSRRYEIKITE